YLSGAEGGIAQRVFDRCGDGQAHLFEYGIHQRTRALRVDRRQNRQECSGGQLLGRQRGGISGEGGWQRWGSVGLHPAPGQERGPAPTGTTRALDESVSKQQARSSV